MKVKETVALIEKMRAYWPIEVQGEADDFVTNHKPRVDGELRCPDCAAPPTGAEYVEDIGCGRRVIGFEDGQLTVDGYYRTDGYDEDSGNERSCCGKCFTEFEVPASIDVEFV